MVGGVCGSTQRLNRPCRSGLVSRKGRSAAPAIYVQTLRTWGRFAPLSRHKAAPTRSCHSFCSRNNASHACAARDR
ncbi:hypothetical protein DMX06_10965 [Pseudomonas mosselii]|nr:hypothetical protein DMX06_10965 [Pseudomonas mosselii]